jgi:hypothetical protein
VSQALVPQETDPASLPALVRRAAAALAGATDAAEVLEARDLAGLVYDAARRAARLAKAKGAHDELVAAAYRAQADALAIEAQAKRRLADEYDAAQDRGEVATQQDGRRPSGREGLKPTADDIGLTHKQNHENRMIRDAEARDPGIVARTVDALLDAGAEPTRAAVRRAVGRKPASCDETVSDAAGRFRRHGPAVRVPAGRTLAGLVAEGLRHEAAGGTATDVAAALGLNQNVYRKARYIVLLGARHDLAADDAAIAREALACMEETGQVAAAWSILEPLVERFYGSADERKGFDSPGQMEVRRRDDFQRAMASLVGTSLGLDGLVIPYLDDAARRAARADVSTALRRLRNFEKRLKEVRS